VLKVRVAWQPRDNGSSSSHVASTNTGWTKRSVFSDDHCASRILWGLAVHSYWSNTDSMGLENREKDQ